MSSGYLPPYSPTATKTPLRLVFTTNSLRNTVIASHDDEIYYEVVSKSWTPTVTRITRVFMDDMIYSHIAEIESAPRQPVRVSMYGEKSMWPAGAFVKFNVSRFTGEFTGDDGNTYVWRLRSGRLELFRAGDERSAPLAVFHSPKRMAKVFRMSQKPYIEIRPDAVTILDSLILSFLLMERNRRDL